MAKDYVVHLQDPNGQVLEINVMAKSKRRAIMRAFRAAGKGLSFLAASRIKNGKPVESKSTTITPNRQLKVLETPSNTSKPKVKHKPAKPKYVFNYRVNADLLTNMGHPEVEEEKNV